MRITISLASLLLLLCFAVSGCGKSESTTPKTGQASDEKTVKVNEDWCVEHGIPESVCTLCDNKVAAEYKKKGDWCKEHDRAKSQCFLCHPELEEKFAAQYETKYGHKPPKIQ